MEEIDLIKSLEIISSKFPNRILKIQGHELNKNFKEYLEIIIFRGFSSSTTHPIAVDLEKQVIDFKYYLTNFKLYEAPLTKNSNNLIRENQNSVFFLDQKNWI